MEGAGVVAAVGSSVTQFKAGDEVYGLQFDHPALPLKPVGFCSEYAVTSERFLLIKPPHLSFTEAASLPGSAITGYQCIKQGLALLNEPEGSFRGKSVFVPGALSSTGSVGVQLLKNVFDASEVVATVSTEKMLLVGEQLPGIVDRLIDYKTQDVAKEVGRGTVDFVYNTQWSLTSTFPLANPQTGVVSTIAGVPTSDILRNAIGANYLPFWAGWLADLVNGYYQWRLRGTNVKLRFVSGNPGVREDLEAVGEILAREKIRPILTEVDLSDLEAVRGACEKVATGKGGVGKLVIKIV